MSSIHSNKNQYPYESNERDLKKKIQYVFVNAHGNVIDTHESIAIKDPKSLLPQEGPDVNKRILTNSFCGNLLYHFKSLTHNYMSYLLNLHQEEDGLDVLWSFTQKQEQKLAEIDQILFPKKKIYSAPLTHLGRTSSEKYYFKYDGKFHENMGETFGIFLFTKCNKGYNGIGEISVFEDLTEDIYRYIHNKTIYKIYSDKQYKLAKKQEPTDLDFVLKRNRPYGYSTLPDYNDNPVVLTSDDIIKYFEEKHNTIVRIISFTCRGSNKKMEAVKSYKNRGKIIPAKEGERVPSDVGPLFQNNNIVRTISGAPNHVLDKYVAPEKILIILIDANGNEHRFESYEGVSGQEVIDYVEKNLKIPSKDQYYFANIAHYESQLNMNDLEDLSLLYFFKYTHNRVRITPYTKQKPIYIYILNYGQYYDIFNDKITNKLYPSFPKDMINDPKNVYSKLYSRLSQSKL